MGRKGCNLSSGYMFLAVVTNCIWKMSAMGLPTLTTSIRKLTDTNLTDDNDQKQNTSLGKAICQTENANETDSYNSQMKFYLVIAYCVTDVFFLASLGLFATSKMKVMSNRPIFICHLLCLLVGYFMLILSHGILVRDRTFLCFAVRHLKQYAFLGSFSWVLVLSFSNWRRFRNLKSLVKAEPSFQSHTFLLQCCFGWGVPLIPCLVSFTLKWRDNHNNTGICSLTGYSQFPVIHILALSCTIVFVTVFSLMTIKNIRRMGKDVAGENPRIHKATFRMSLKLILLMSVEHIFCFITKVVAAYVEGNKKVWDILNLIEGFQGIYIFLLYLQQLRPIDETVKLCCQKLNGTRKTEREEITRY